MITWTKTYHRWSKDYTHNVLIDSALIIFKALFLKNIYTKILNPIQATTHLLSLVHVQALKYRFFVEGTAQLLTHPAKPVT